MPSESHPTTHAKLEARIDIELRMLADAIELVRRGASDRVTLGGLTFGDQLLRRAQGMASQAGLGAHALYSTDESTGTDLVIERNAPGSGQHASGGDT